MALIEHAVEQGSPEWFEAKRGVLSASAAKQILTATGKKSSTYNTVIGRLIAERMQLQNAVDSFSTDWMEHGITTEAEAADAFTLMTDLDVRECGFFQDGHAGCSPDRILNGDLISVEIKCPKPSTHITYLMNGEKLPNEYVQQVHFQIALLDAPHGYFMSYCEGAPPMLLKVDRDKYTELMKDTIDQFQSDFETAWQRVREW